MATLTLSFAPQTRVAAAAVAAPRKNLRVVGLDMTDASSFYAGLLYQGTKTLPIGHLAYYPWRIGVPPGDCYNLPYVPPALNWAYKRLYDGVNYRLRTFAGGRFASHCRPTSIVIL